MNRRNITVKNFALMELAVQKRRRQSLRHLIMAKIEATPSHLSIELYLEIHLDITSSFFFNWQTENEIQIKLFF